MEKTTDQHYQNILTIQSDLSRLNSLLNTIKFGDCLELMLEIPDNSIDLIKCDLPYGTTQNQWDTIIPFHKLWEQYERVIKPNGNIVLNAAQPFATDLINSNRKLFKYDLIWYKPLGSGHLNANRMPMRNHEHILVFYKKPGTYNPQMGIGNRKTGVRKPDRNGDNYGKFKNNIPEKFDDMGKRFPQSVIEITNGDRTIENDHPTQKPIDLERYLIRTYSNEGDIVLDNCIGSGTTAVACIMEKRNFIGFENNDVYFDIATKRINQLLTSPSLF